MEHRLDVVHRHFQRIGGDLRTDGFEALADGGGADIDRDLAVGFEHEARALLRAGRAAFEVAADRGAAITAVDQLALDRRLCAPIDLVEAARQRHPVVAAVGFRSDVERRDGGEPVGHLGFGDEIAPAERNAIEAELGGGDVEQPLAKEVSLEAAGAAIGSRRRLVGHHQRHVDAHVRNAVRPGEHLRDVARGRRPVGADIGALIGAGASAQRQDRAVPVARDLQFTFGIAGMIGGEQMLAAILDPLHRPAGEACRERDQKVLRIEFAARAEAAADVVLHHADGAFG